MQKRLQCRLLSAHVMVQRLNSKNRRKEGREKPEWHININVVSEVEVSVDGSSFNTARQKHVPQDTGD